MKWERDVELKEYDRQSVLVCGGVQRFADFCTTTELFLGAIIEQFRSCELSGCSVLAC